MKKNLLLILLFSSIFYAKSQTVKDIDGNVYNTVIIGTQTWITENIKTTRYNDSSSIPNVSDNTEWRNQKTGAYCWYKNDKGTYGSYGPLYNYYTVNTGKLCPTKWHVPSDIEWTTLITYLGGESSAGGKLKEVGLTHWRIESEGVNNSSKFSAVGGGFRDGGGSFYDIKNFGYWWGSTQLNTNEAWSIYIVYTFDGTATSHSKMVNGHSVRCLIDTLPIVVTSNIINIKTISATGGGDISYDGGANITVRGICWSNSQNPTINDNKSIDGDSTGLYTSNLTNLVADKLYYVRAYATNNVGTAYGNEVSFTTASVSIPTLLTKNINAIKSSSAISGGIISYDGGANITVRGICWSNSQNPTINDYKTIAGDTSNSYTSNLSNLLANTLYYVRAYATNRVGTAYGNEVSFTTQEFKDTTIIPNSIILTQFDQISICPNPATNKLNINANGVINIFDLQGKLCIKSNSNHIDISNLKKGIYIVKFGDSKHIAINKLIKE
jgi:uncharacterized protein (TIGR02145 family)